MPFTFCGDALPLSTLLVSVRLISPPTQRLTAMTLLRCLLLSLALGLTLTACSRIALVYDNLDWLIPWRLDNYLDLDREQKTWLKPQLQAHLQWHCSSELPRYLDWLQRTQTLLEQPEPSATALNAQLTEIDTAVARIGHEITPTAIALLQSLDDEQVAELFAELGEKNREAREKFLEPPLAKQIQERQQRLEKRLRPWLGRLNERQQIHLEQWATRLGGHSRIWMDNRLRWQRQLRAALQNRDSPGFAERLSHLLQEPQAYYGAEYREAYEHARQATATLFSQLLASADAGQRQRLSQRLSDLRGDFNEQRCSATVAS